MSDSGEINSEELLAQGDELLRSSRALLEDLDEVVGDGPVTPPAAD